MKTKRMFAVAALLQAAPGWLVQALCALLAVLALAACVSDDRLAGTSTEAGNAGGKLYLPDGAPAAGISVALVARSFVPDTSGVRDGDAAGLYYRTRTDGDGRFLVEGVEPGTYRVMAVGAGGGAMAESLVVRVADTVHVEKTLKPLGALRGVAKVVGTNHVVAVWVRPVATVKNPPVADSQGGFRLDSLPEGQYELLPQCFACVPVDSAYRVWVQAGRDTLITDTLKVYPDYFLGFPAAGELEVMAGDFPHPIAGKPSEAENDAVRPLSAQWTWNGAPVPGVEIRSDGRISQTAMMLDSTFLDGTGTGRAAVSLVFPDTVVSREWTVRILSAPPLLPMAAVEVDSAFPVPGVSKIPRWRFRMTGIRRLAPEDVAFWGLSGLAGGGGSLEESGWISLAVAGPESAMVTAASGPEPLTFLLVPDSVYGGRVFRPRRDERLADFANIRLLDRGRLGFTDPVVPSMRPDGLLLDRRRGRSLQRYHVDAAGRVVEVLGPLLPPGGGALAEPPLLFWRSGAGFAWDEPARGAAKGLAVTREGRAYRLDTAVAPVDLPAAELSALEAMLGVLALDPPVRPDTAAEPVDGISEYLHYGGRGLLLPSGRDTLLAAFHAWMSRNRLDGSGPAFPLGDSVWRFAGFAMDPDFRNTGDTLVLVLTPSGSGVGVREGYSLGSVARMHGGGGEAVYRLFQDGDTLVAQADGGTANSILFGDIEGRRSLFAVAGLRVVAVEIENGLPVLGGGIDILAGRMDGDLAGWGEVLASPGFLLDGRSIGSGGMGKGLLFTTDGGLERVWYFGGRSKTINGWNRL